MASGRPPEAPPSMEELLRRLEEAEETIRAIREGEVDALVIRPSDAEQIFTLQGGNDSYRAFMETMGHGAVALGSDGEILYANRILTSLIGRPLAELQGKPLPGQFPPPASARLRMLLDDAAASAAGASACELLLRLGDEDRHSHA
jgi:PAS domain-containing protein